MSDPHIDFGASERNPIVFVKNGAVFTTSRDLAENSGKRHDNILRDIDNLAESLTPQNWGMLFSVISEPHPTVPGRLVRYFEMTRKGFVLLGMGFTGSEWVAWKLRYIDAFDLMEAELRKQPDLNHPATLRGLLANYVERAEKAEAKITILEPKADVYDQVCASDILVTPTIAAKLFKESPKKLMDWMRANKWMHRVYEPPGNAPNEPKIKAGLMEVKIGPIPEGPGKDRIVTQPYLTGRGVFELAKAYFVHQNEVLWPLLARLDQELKLLAGPR